MAKKAKKRNAADLTGRNEKALKKLIKRLTERVEALEENSFDVDFIGHDIDIAVPSPTTEPDQALPNDDQTQQVVE